MRARVETWGDDLAVRLPSVLAEELGLEEGSPIELRLVDGCLVVTSESLESSLDDLLEGVSAANLHGEVSTGPALGAEAG